MLRLGYDNETIRLNKRANGGMYFTILLEINENKGIKKAEPSGTTIRKIGFTIFALVSFEDLVFRNVDITGQLRRVLTLKLPHQ